MRRSIQKAPLLMLALLLTAAPARSSEPLFKSLTRDRGDSAVTAEMEQRLGRVEQVLEGRGLADMLQRLEQLQQEVRQLRGEVEVQTHTLEGLRKRQRDLYVDIDRRLHRLETGAAAQAVPPSTSLPSAEPGVPAAVAPTASTAPPIPAVTPSAQLNPPDTPPAAPAVLPVTDTAAERMAYDKALAILHEGRYQPAGEAFQAFLEAYPRSTYADNAQYWLAETFYVTRKFPEALAEFGKVLSAYPGSQKQADARLKLGYVQYELADWEAARRELSEVVSRYPGSTAARLAQTRLQRMDTEGR